MMQWETARIEFEKGLTMRMNAANQSRCYTGIGRADFYLGKYNESSEAFNRALALKRDNPYIPMLSLAKCHAAVGDSITEQASGKFDTVFGLREI